MKAGHILHLRQDSQRLGDNLGALASPSRAITTWNPARFNMGCKNEVKDSSSSATSIFAVIDSSLSISAEYYYILIPF